jgi:hypothetical protein
MELMIGSGAILTIHELGNPFLTKHNQKSFEHWEPNERCIGFSMFYPPMELKHQKYRDMVDCIGTCWLFDYLYGIVNLPKCLVMIMFGNPYLPNSIKG